MVKPKFFSFKEYKKFIEYQFNEIPISEFELFCFYLITQFNLLICYVFGHKWYDNDPGDPEVGPQPDVSCRRCGEIDY